MPQDTNPDQMALLKAIASDPLCYERHLRPVDLKPGQLVCTGPIMGQTSPVRRVGYCVQVRLQAGEFGSDMVLLRHLDRSLTPHSNQSFYALSDEQQCQAAPLFAALLEEEDLGGDHTYTLGADHPKKGFMVEADVGDDAALESPPALSPFMLKTVTTTKDGATQTTLTAFIG